MKGITLIKKWRPKFLVTLTLYRSNILASIAIFFISSAIQASELQQRVLDQLNQSPKLDDLLKNDILYAQQSTEKKRFNVIIIPKQQFAPPSAGASLEIYNEHIKKTTDKVLTFAPNKADFRLKRRFLSVNAIAAEVTLNGLHQLSNAPEVKFIGLDVGGQGALNEARPQVNISSVRQQYGYTGKGVEVAILDTGIDTDHGDLQDRVISQKCFADLCPGGPDIAEDDNGHGTHVSGIIASSGLYAPEGGSPDVRIHVVKVLDSSNSFSEASIIIAALDYVINELPQVDIVNMSLGTNWLSSSDCDETYAFTRSFSSAINTLRERGTLSFVSSMNNAAEDSIGAPACIRNAIAVGAVYDTNPSPYYGTACVEVDPEADKLACFSNSSASIDLVALGSPISSTRRNGGSTIYSGTSMSTPLVASCAALLLEHDESLTPLQIELALETSETLVNDKLGRSFPRLDCAAAISSTISNQTLSWSCPEAPDSTFEFEGSYLKIISSDEDNLLVDEDLKIQTNVTCAANDCNTGKGFEKIEQQRLRALSSSGKALIFQLLAPSPERPKIELKAIYQDTCEALIQDDYRYEDGIKPSTPVVVPPGININVNRFSDQALPEPSAASLILAGSEGYEGESSWKSDWSLIAGIGKFPYPLKFALYGEPRHIHWEVVAEVIEVLNHIAPSLRADFAETHTDVTLPIHISACESWQESSSPNFCSGRSSGQANSDFRTAFESHVWVDVRDYFRDSYLTNLPTLRHELGHIAGLLHTPCPGSQMSISSEVGQGVYFNASDLAIIATIHDDRFVGGMTLEEARIALNIEKDSIWDDMLENPTLACNVLADDSKWKSLYAEYASSAIIDQGTPIFRDFDGDGVPDSSDVFPRNPSYSQDADGDGMADNWEIDNGFNPTDPFDSNTDSDNDGITALNQFVLQLLTRPLDLDSNGEYDALTDGLLLLRRMFGLTGDALVSGVIADNSPYPYPDDVERHFNILDDLVDIDGDASIDALTDGLVTLRYLFGLRGEVLVDDVISNNASRKSSAEVEARIELLVP